MATLLLTAGIATFPGMTQAQTKAAAPGNTQTTSPAPELDPNDKLLDGSYA